jgi:hypothetical protein
LHAEAGRAPIVGEVTRGAHFVIFSDRSPFRGDGRSATTSPLTKSNWEGTGVVPDVRSGDAAARHRRR